MTLYAQIERNKRKSVLVIVLFLLVVAAVGAAVGILAFGSWEAGLIVAAVFGVFYSLIMLSQGTDVVMRMNRAREIRSEDEHPFLWNTVEALAIAARVPMPRVFIIDDPSPNAFAAGPSPQKAAVAATTGLLERLNREEIEAVMAHEMAHVRNYDVRLATIVLALVSAVVALSHLAQRMFWLSGGRSSRRDDNKNQGNPILLIVALVVAILGPLVATIVQFAISRNREYLADAGGAELCRNPGALASALEKISGIKEPMQDVPQAAASLYFADPFKKQAVGLFATHPPVEERIRRLRAMLG